jgi:hypothetical protein|tara:strand:- start:1902 stop:2573 length:672 start_codon:yes stop_codon:yes gene_type:complete
MEPKKKFFFSKVYHLLFKEKFNKKLVFNFPEKVSRLDLIKRAITKNNYQAYLEIGCDDDKIFNSINIKKIGVDPFSGGNFRGTSDEFFLQNKNKFDCIFIDGLHIYEQVKKDILNSIDCLSANGIIILHDCLPQTISAQAVPRYRYLWNGDVWKAVVEARTWNQVNTVTVLVDQGVSIIKKNKNTDVLKIEIQNFKKLKFEDFYNNHKKYMRIVNYDDLEEYI